MFVRTWGFFLKNLILDTVQDLKHKDRAHIVFKNSVTWTKNDTSINEKHIDDEHNCF